MINQSLKLKLFASAALLAASVSSSQAQWCLAGDWQTPLTWQAGANPMTAGPSAGEYSYTITGGTPGAYGNAKATDGTWNNSWPTSGNLMFLYDSTGSATIHFWPGVNNDGWIPGANRLGYDDPNNDPGWSLAGSFNTWGTAINLNSLGSGVYSNSVTDLGAPDNMSFKFQSPQNSWADINFASPDFGNGNGNGSYPTISPTAALPVVIDLPDGRYYVGAPALPPTNYITFQLDMSEQVSFGNFTNTDPNTMLPVNSVAVGGLNGDWGTDQQLTNYTILNPGDLNPGLKTNLYIGTFQTSGYLPLTFNWKFRVNGLDGGYEQPASTLGQNRVTAITNANQVLQKLYYDDLGLGDLTLSPVTVNFALYMPPGTLDDAGYAFNPSATPPDQPYISGAYWGWPAWGYGNLPSSQQLFLSSVPNVYTNSFVLPRGTSIYMNYKYSINGLDDENNLNANPNHFRLIRSNGSSYAFPQDVWSWTLTNSAGTNMFIAGLPTSPTNIVEIDFGNLKIGAPVGPPLAPATFPITWVGRPAVQLQSKSSLTSGLWTSYGGTDSANSTNWPASGSGQFFRLIKN